EPALVFRAAAGGNEGLSGDLGRRSRTTGAAAATPSGSAYGEAAASGRRRCVLDRGRRGAARRRGCDERRRPAAEHEARPARARARQPAGGERGAFGAALECRVGAADPGTGGQAARARAGDVGPDLLREAAPLEEDEREPPRQPADQAFAGGPD